MYAIIAAEDGEYTIGYYPHGLWIPVEDVDDKNEAERRCAHMNRIKETHHEVWRVIESEPGLWTIGHYGGFDNTWYPWSNHDDHEVAINKAAWLNGMPASKGVHPLPDNVTRHVDAILDELNKAINKHPNWPSDVVYADAVINEEKGELTRLCVQLGNAEYPYEYLEKDMYNEAVQTAAMCIRFMMNMGEYKKTHKNE